MDEKKREWDGWGLCSGSATAMIWFGSRTLDKCFNASLSHGVMISLLFSSLLLLFWQIIPLLCGIILAARAFLTRFARCPGVIVSLAWTAPRYLKPVWVNSCCCYSLNLSPGCNAPSKSRLPPVSISSLAAQNFFLSPFTQLTFIHITTKLSFTTISIHLTLLLIISLLHLSSQTHQKCLPKLPRRSPLLEARPPQARLPSRRRKLARRLRHLQAIKRSGIRREKRPTLPTSIKVSSISNFRVLSSFLLSTPNVLLLRFATSISGPN